MAKNLWALEENDLVADAAALDTTPEEGEAAAIIAEGETEGTDVVETADAINTGADATGLTEEVVEVVEQATEEGEGLDPIAAESLRIAMKAIARSVGANPAMLNKRYASENFAAASSRKGNSTHALEGVQEFLKDLWKKIKAALNTLWTKAKAMWAKHLSNVGRMNKALESMKGKVKASSGKITGKAYLDKAPSSLSALYKSASDINAKIVGQYVNYNVPLAGMTSSIENFASSVSGMASSSHTNNSKATAALAAASKIADAVSFSFPVVGGETVKVESELDSEAETFKFEITREPESSTYENQGLAIADKSTLTKLLSDAQAMIKAVAAHQKNSQKTADKINEAFNGIEKLLQGGAVSDAAARGIASKAGVEDSSATTQQQIRKIMRIAYKAAAASAKVEQLFIAESLRASKGVLMFTAACLKQYK